MTAHDLSAGAAVLAEVSAAAQRALRHYDLPAASTARLLCVSENASFLVEDPDVGATHVLRVHRRGYHARAGIESELDWLTALRTEAGIRTPRVRRARDGGRIVKSADGGTPARDCVLFEFLPGAPPPLQDLVPRFAELGALTARLHVHARSWVRPAGFTRFHWDFDAALGTIARWGRWHNSVVATERDLLQRAQRMVQLRLRRYGKQPDRYGLIHADLRLANLLVTSEGGEGSESGAEAAVIDFDDCGFGWYLYDLAASLSFIEDDPRIDELIEAWLAGYRTAGHHSDGALSAADETEVWTFVLFRRLLLLAWISSHPAAETARQLGPNFAAGTCELAERYLSMHQ